MQKRIYQGGVSDQSDDGFEPVRLAHLVAGNRARLLDPRRTPVTIIALHKDIAAFSVEINSFEDKGAIWQLPLWDVRKFQIQKEASLLPHSVVSELQFLVEKYDQETEIQRDHKAGLSNQRKLMKLRKQADDWMNTHSDFFQQDREIDLTKSKAQPSLQSDLAAWLDQFGLREMDTKIASTFASNPASTELIKGHRMVLAEMGLCPFTGMVQRDPTLFFGAWSFERRAMHILARMAFVQTLFLRLGYAELPLFRSLYSNADIERPRNKGFVSTTFSGPVAQALFESGQTCEKAVMIWQKVPISRLFMTYLETEQLNQPYQEAEAILLYDPDNMLF